MNPAIATDHSLTLLPYTILKNGTRYVGALDADTRADLLKGLYTSKNLQTVLIMWMLAYDEDKQRFMSTIRDNADLIISRLDLDYFAEFNTMFDADGIPTAEFNEKQREYSRNYGKYDPDKYNKMNFYYQCHDLALIAAVGNTRLNKKSRTKLDALLKPARLEQMVTFAPDRNMKLAYNRNAALSILFGDVLVPKDKKMSFFIPHYLRHII